jgi:predicted enzyme related to lactoylglutathione lyase
MVMPQSFVWFHNSSDNPSDSSRFYEKLLGWTASEGPGGLTMLTSQAGPFAGLAKRDGGAAAGWVPYVQVDDVDGATNAAVTLGATVVSAKVRGPAGEYSVVRDPGGASIALWHKA